MGISEVFGDCEGVERGRVGKTESTEGESVLFLLFLTLQAACREKSWSGGKTPPRRLLGGNRLVGDDEL